MSLFLDKPICSNTSSGVQSIAELPCNRISIGFGVLPVEVLAYMYQVAWVSAANWLRNFYLLILNLTEYWV